MFCFSRRLVGRAKWRRAPDDTLIGSPPPPSSETRSSLSTVDQLAAEVSGDQCSTVGGGRRERAIPPSRTSALNEPPLSLPVRLLLALMMFALPVAPVCAWRRKRAPEPRASARRYSILGARRSVLGPAADSRSPCSLIFQRARPRLSPGSTIRNATTTTTTTSSAMRGRGNRILNAPGAFGWQSNSCRSSQCCCLGGNNGQQKE